jgi:hypothetical protein
MRNEPIDGVSQDAFGAQPFTTFSRNRAAVLLAATAILAAFALVLLTRPAAENAAREIPAAGPLAARSADYGTARRASPDEIRAYFNDMFDRLDRDGSGFVEPAEVPRLQVTSVTVGDGTIRQLPLTQAEWLAQGDGDRDGRVTRTEYFARLIPPVQAIFGVPPGWQPSDGERPDRAATELGAR